MTNTTPESEREALDLLNRAPGKRPTFLGEPAIDHIFSMVMELSSQLYVLKERLYAYESLNDEANLISKERIENWAPSEAQANDLEAMRQEMLQNLFRTVTAKEPHSKMPPETRDPSPPS